MISGIELFSGAGGLATGLELAGVSHNAFVEWNSEACRTLRRNYATEIVFERDIRNFDFAPHKGVDIIAGGPPCQPFSLGGKAKGNLDDRDMFPSAIRAVRELLPKVFLFENVKGLLRTNFKTYLNHILTQLTFPTMIDLNHACHSHHEKSIEKSGSVPLNEQYEVSVNLVNAADYGIPQKRERVIIVGIRKDLDLSWSLPTPTHSMDALLWDKYVTNKYWEKHSLLPSNSEYAIFKKYKGDLEARYGLFSPDSLPWVTIRDTLLNLPTEGDTTFYPSEHVIREGAKEYQGHTGSPIDEPAKTIKAGAHGVPGGENMIKFPDGSVRYFTVFEAKRIQTFPDNYQIVGSWTESMRQLGNAVPVRLAQIIGRSIIELINQ